MTEFQTALISLQNEMKAPKSQHNDFGNYNYRSAEDILEAVKPLCAKYQLLLNLTDEMVEVGGRVYCKATATIYKGQLSMSSTSYAREAEAKKLMDDSQITGTASSYARKYALSGLLLLDDTKDADATNTHGKTPKKESKEPEKPSRRDALMSEMFAIKAECMSLGIPEAAINAWYASQYGEKPAGKLNDAELGLVIGYLKKLMEEKLEGEQQ